MVLKKTLFETIRKGGLTIAELDSSLPLDKNSPKYGLSTGSMRVYWFYFVTMHQLIKLNPEYYDEGRDEPRDENTDTTPLMGHCGENWHRAFLHIKIYHTKYHTRVKGAASENSKNRTSSTAKLPRFVTAAHGQAISRVTIRSTATAAIVRPWRHIGRQIAKHKPITTPGIP